MKKFIQAYPEYQKLSGNVNKHISLLEELSHTVGERNLLDLSELEQNIVCQGDFPESTRVFILLYLLLIANNNHIFQLHYYYFYNYNYYY